MLFAALFGDFWGPVVFWAVVACVIIYKICEACNAHEQKQKEENLKYTNPEVYAQLKQMEHERQMIAHDEKRMKHENAHAGVGIFAEILRNIFK
jgi:hypothetical protein